MATVIASLQALIGADTKGFEQGTKRVKGGMSDMARSIGSAIPASVTQFLTLGGAVTAVGIAFKKSWDNYMLYADQVRQLSMLSGASAEDSSRLIQVLDDYGISAENALTATRALTQNGLTPSIETLAKLSDQYLAINTVQGKNEFVLKNLGRNGLVYVDVLNKGSAALLKQGNAVEAGLILNQKQLDQQKLLKVGWDALGDTLTSYTNQIMPAFSAGLLDALDVTRDWIGTFRILGEQGVELKDMTLENVAAAYVLAGAQRTEADTAMLAAGANNANADSLDNTKEATKAAEQALRDYESQLEAVSQANLDMESMSRDVANYQKQYAEDHAAAMAALAQATKEGSKEGIAEAQSKIQELEATWHESAQNMIYDMILVGLSAGGLLDSEQKALDEYAVKAGIKTQADIDEANRRREIADATIAGILQSEDVLAEQRKIDDETLRLQEATTSAEKITAASNEAAAIGQVSQMTQQEIRHQQMLALAAQRTAAAYNSIPRASGGGSGSGTSGSGGSGGNVPSMDSGGAGIAGQPYLIGVGAQPEMFTPKTNGTFTPNADKKLGGTTINIVVNNPKRETAENSIRKSLKSASYTGAFG